MIVPFEVLYMLNGIAMVCSVACLIDAGLQRTYSVHSVRFTFRVFALLLAFGLTAVIAVVYAFGTAVPEAGGYRIGW